MTRPLPQIPRETLERFWRGEPGEEPIKPLIDRRQTVSERKRLDFKKRYQSDPETYRARARDYYQRNRERILARQRARRKGRAK